MKTYTINQNLTGNEVEVMSLAQLQALVKSRIEAGEDPQEVVGFVVVEYEGEIYGGITHPSHGTPSALEDGLDVLYWWNDEWSEKDYKWLWEDPSENKVTVLEKRSVEREYGMEGTEAIVIKDGEKLLLTDGFGGIDDLRGGAVRWCHGKVVKLKAEDTFEGLDAEFNVYFSVLDRALKAMDPERPLLCLHGRQIESIAEKAGL